MPAPVGVIASSVQSGPPPFPPTIPNLQMWFDADYTASLGGTAPAVSSWADRSGGGFNLAATGTQPARSVGGLKAGRTSIDWASGSRPLVNAGGTNQKPFTAFAAIKQTGTAADRAVLATSVAGGLNWQINTTHRQVFNKHYIAGIGTSTTPVPTNASAIIALSYSATGEWRFYLNGTLDGTGTNNETLDASPPQTVVGEGAGQPFVGTIGEIIKYSRVLSDAERGQVTSYLQGKWQDMAVTPVGTPAISGYTVYGTGVAVPLPSKVDNDTTIVAISSPLLTVGQITVTGSSVKSWSLLRSAESVAGVAITLLSIVTNGGAGATALVTLAGIGSGDSTGYVAASYRNLASTALGTTAIGPGNDPPVAFNVPGITEVSGGRVLLAGVQQYAGSTAPTSSGFAAVGAGHGMWILERATVTPGASGPYSVLPTVTWNNTAGFAVALRP